MNYLIKNYISARGLGNAMKTAQTLIEQNYQVMVQHDDCDIYIIAYTDNDAYEYGSDRFALISEAEEDMIVKARDAAKNKQAKECVQLSTDRDRNRNRNRDQVDKRDDGKYITLIFFLSTVIFIPCCDLTIILASAS